jgi:hypothetical protein
LTAGKTAKGAMEIFKGCSNLREITVLNPFCDFDPMIQRVPTGAVKAADAQYILVYYTENTLAHKAVTWEEILPQ